MREVLKTFISRFVSPAEIDALRLLRAEHVMASRHREGLKKMRREVLNRPAKLNLGSGPYKKPGFVNVDLSPIADLTLDLRRGLPFDSDCCGTIFSEHCFEHFDYPEPISSLFRECFRVLEPNGELCFSVPDTEWPLSDYRMGAEAPYFKACREHPWHPATCATRLEHINYHFRQNGEHRYAYDFETAEKILRQTGFVDIRKRCFDQSLDSQHRQIGSLFVAARKPANG